MATEEARSTPAAAATTAAVMLTAAEARMVTAEAAATATAMAAMAVTTMVVTVVLRALAAAVAAARAIAMVTTATVMAGVDGNDDSCCDGGGEGNGVELYPDSVFWYETFIIFPVFSYRIPKGNSVGKFGIIKLVGALYTHMVTTHRRLLSARILPLALFQCGGGGGFSS